MVLYIEGAVSAPTCTRCDFVCSALVEVVASAAGQPTVIVAALCKDCVEQLLEEFKAVYNGREA